MHPNKGLAKNFEMVYNVTCEDIIFELPRVIKALMPLLLWQDFIRAPDWEREERVLFRCLTLGRQFNLSNRKGRTLR